MSSLLNQFPAGIVCFLFVLCCALLTSSGLWFFRRKVSRESLRKMHDVTGIMFGTCSLLYSLVLAFVIIAVWDDYEELNSAIEGETSKLANIVGHSTDLPPALADSIQSRIEKYTENIIANWRKPDHNKSSLMLLSGQLLWMRPDSAATQGIIDHIGDELTAADDYRRARLLHQHSHVPQLVWMVLVAGSIITIFFSYFFSAEPVSRHYLFVALLTTIIGMSIFLVYMLDHPFISPAGVSPLPFEELQALIISQKK